MHEVWGVVRERAETSLEDLAEGRDRRLNESLLTLHAIADEACAGLGVALDTRTLRLVSMALVVANSSRGPARWHAWTHACCECSRRSEHHPPDARRSPATPASRAPAPGHAGKRCRAAIVVRTCNPNTPRCCCCRGRCAYARQTSGRSTSLCSAPTRSPSASLSSRPTKASILSSWTACCRPHARKPEASMSSAYPKVLWANASLMASRPCCTSTGSRSCGPGCANTHINRTDFPATGFTSASTRHSRKAQLRATTDVPSGFTSARTSTIAGRSMTRRSTSTISEASCTRTSAGGRRWTSPRRSIQFVQVAELTLVALVCEDLAQNDDIAEIIRSVGPTVVMTGLLDGPQLTSRWAARYASVLADDPGSAVLTLTSYGMVQRSRPHRRDASPVVALWKDPSRGVREIPLETGAQAVLLTVCMDRATRRSADGRWPIDNGTACFDVAVHQVHAATPSSHWSPQAARTATPRALESDEVTVLTGWAEAVAEALPGCPDRTAAVLSNARRDAPWRPAMQLAQPTGRLADAIASLHRFVVANATSSASCTYDSVLATARQEVRDEKPLDRMVRRALLSMLEERQTRRTDTASHDQCGTATCEFRCARLSPG